MSKIVDTNNKEYYLTAVIANWFHCKGVGFSVASFSLFCETIRNAMSISINYYNPSQNKVGGTLLFGN